MPVKSYKATSAGRRFQSVLDFSDLTRKAPEKSLLEPLKKTGGRNVRGKVTAWHRGGGHKRRYRIIDFRRDKLEIPAVVKAIEYDPNRSARIALLAYSDGEKRYVLAPNGLSVGDSILASDSADIKPGNTLRLQAIPLGTLIHNLELKAGRGGQLIRSAGVAGQLMAKEGAHAHIKMPSGEVRLIRLECRATIGQVGNLDHENVSIGKAGRNRHLGWRPVVRGVAMNPVDHPLGGGEGKSSGGRHPCTPWGVPTKGYKTRRGKRPSDKYIVKRRK